MSARRLSTSDEQRMIKQYFLDHRASLSESEFERGSDVGGLSFDADSSEALQIKANDAAAAGGHGIINETDARYISARASHIEQHQTNRVSWLRRRGWGIESISSEEMPIVSMTAAFEPVAAGDRISCDELDDLFEQLKTFLERADAVELVGKLTLNFLTRLVDGNVNEHDLKRWLPRIAELRARGVFE